MFEENGFFFGSCPEGENCVLAEGSAEARAVIGKTMVTVQEVRAVKDSLEPNEIIEIF